MVRLARIALQQFHGGLVGALSIVVVQEVKAHSDTGAK